MKFTALLVSTLKLAVLTFVIFFFDVIVRALVVPAVFSYLAYALAPFKYFYLYVFGVVIYHVFNRRYYPTVIVSLLAGFFISYALYVLTLVWDHDEWPEYIHHAVAAMFISVALHVLYRLLFRRGKQVINRA